MSCKTCFCEDDEAYKYGECFCRCHHNAEQRAFERVQTTVIPAAPAQPQGGPTPTPPACDKGSESPATLQDELE
jgi:hypothetical protein